VSKRRRQQATVWHISDGVMCTDTWRGKRINAKVMKDGRGYVKTGRVAVLYAKVARIIVRL
jgi:hypothetical protein